MPSPIPLHCPRTDTISIGTGTGFVVGIGSARWLLTCVHLVTGLIATPVTALQLFATHLKVPGSDTIVPLVRGTELRPLIARDPTDGTFFDALSIRLSDAEAQALAAFGIYDGSNIANPTVGDSVVTKGFPHLQEAASSPTKHTSKIIQVHGVSVVLSKPLTPGISGSPVMSKKGLVGIAYGDLGFEPNFTNGVVNSFKILAPVLFK